MAIKRITHTVAGVELVRKLAESGRRFFTAEQARKLAPSVGISPGYFLQALHHLARTGWIVRLKKGLYSLSGSVPGATPLHEFEIAMTLVKPAAISHWSALSHYGLTEQTPRRVYVLTTARSVPRIRHRDRARRAEEGTQLSAASRQPSAATVRPAEDGYSVGDTTYQFIQVKPERFFGIENVWVHESRIKMTDPERTLLDGLMMPHYCGDFSEVLHAFEVRAPNLDIDRIIRFALKLDAATIKRLGWILERQGIKPEQLEPLRKVPIKGYRALDPSGPRQGPCDAGWMIQVNLPGKARS
jgi:predicted transcriptional regulator of viral defense system